MNYQKFKIGQFGTGGLPSFKTGRIANGTGDAALGRLDGTGPSDEGQGKSDGGPKKKKKRRKVDTRKIKGL